MRKEDLKTKWGAYADTDKLVDDVMSLLTEYNHRNTEHGVCKMLDTYFTNKEPLIRLLKDVDGFDNNLRLVATKEFERMSNRDEIYRQLNKLRDAISMDEFLLSKTDDDGKTVSDYFKIGIKRFDISKLDDHDFAKNLYAVAEHLDMFDNRGYTRKSRDVQNKFFNATYLFDRIISSTISAEKAKEICEQLDSKKYSAGLKTSRAFNKVCEQFGVTAYKTYNKWFAAYSDMVSGGTRKLDFIVSLNPYDYLTMSFGKSWASCHTIDKMNRRNMPSSYSGQYCGGTLSYMLDKTSIITYVIDKGGDPQTCGKIYRNMFHYEDKVLVQGRVYPQGNDGTTDLYDVFRGYMHDVLNKAIKPDNTSWEMVIRGDCSRYTSSSGVHYQDYCCYDGCNVSSLSGTDTSNAIVHIGHSGMCPYCGESYSSSNLLSHSDCTITE